ncbi:MAG: mannitol-1-phosphate 5-dehydrogenase [Treponema sp.]|nr:mannitol-1-phosphate 5-dehydrogenase [Treponema sp.]
MKLVQFGAGNIGRSFIGQIFFRAGWEVVFIDIDEGLVKFLNQKQYYTVVIKRESQTDEVRRIGPVRAVDGRDAAAAAIEVADADIIGTSVGKNALPRVIPVIAKGLAIRRKLETGLNGVSTPGCPLNIIIAENDREAPALFRSVLSAELGPEYPLNRLVGLVETSIGKMVPIMKAADLAEDPLQLFAEEYETLIVDNRGFRGSLPDIPALYPVDPIAAYVDRKLFIHNLGHAAGAYLGYAASVKNKVNQQPRPEGRGNRPLSTNQTAFTIPEVLALPGVEQIVRSVMNEAADALVKEYPQSQYPGSYSRDDLSGHIEDLLFRFKNRLLGDTVHRVGRDLRRKLAREDRITGAMLLCAKHGLPFGTITKVYRAALDFAAPAEDGTLFPADEEFRKTYGLDCSVQNSGCTPEQVQRILREVSGLDDSRSEDYLVHTKIISSPYSMLLLS